MMDKEQHKIVIASSLFGAGLLGFGATGFFIIFYTAIGVISGELPLKALLLFITPALIVGLPIGIGLYISGRRSFNKESQEGNTEESAK